jgi:hypothetical protein
MRFRCSELFQ